MLSVIEKIKDVNSERPKPITSQWRKYRTCHFKKMCYKMRETSSNSDWNMEKENINPNENETKTIQNHYKKKIQSTL